MESDQDTFDKNNISEEKVQPEDTILQSPLADIEKVVELGQSSTYEDGTALEQGQSGTIDVENIVVSEQGESADQSQPLSTNTDVKASLTDEGANTAPNISSYFSQVPDSDPFGAAASANTRKAEADLAPPTPVDIKLELPSKDRELRPQEEDGQLCSPPIAKDEMSNPDFPEPSDNTVDLSLTTGAELDRMYDAWISSEPTRHFLVQALAAGGNFNLPPERVLKPRLAMADTQADPLYQETFKLRGERETQKREKILNLSQVEHNMGGLHQLIKGECWRSALDLTAILLTNMGQGLQPAPSSNESVITQQSMRVWAVRIALLTKLRLYSVAEAECQQFAHMDSPELHFEFHYKKYPGRSGSMVPFNLRLLYACVPQFLGRQHESLDRLFYMRGQVNRILHNLRSGGCEDGGATVITEASREASLALWHQRELKVIYSLAGCLTDMRDYRLAIAIYQDILARDPSNACFTYSTMGRLCLQMGALKIAEGYFSQSVEACMDKTLKDRLAATHSGFLNVCYGENSDAPALFSLASSADTPSAHAKNNAAVSMFYNGQLKAGMLLLEELIHSDPVTYLQESLVNNLVTLYELETPSATAKKHSLLFLANQYKGNGFNINCLKIST